MPPELRHGDRHSGSMRIADPSKRPAVRPRLQQVDPKIATQEEMLMPYLQLEQFDVAIRIMNESLDRDDWRGPTAGI